MMQGSTGQRGDQVVPNLIWLLGTLPSDFLGFSQEVLLSESPRTHGHFLRLLRQEVYFARTIVRMGRNYQVGQEVTTLLHSPFPPVLPCMPSPASKCVIDSFELSGQWGKNYIVLDCINTDLQWCFIKRLGGLGGSGPPGVVLRNRGGCCVLVLGQERDPKPGTVRQGPGVERQ